MVNVSAPDARFNKGDAIAFHATDHLGNPLEIGLISFTVHPDGADAFPVTIPAMPQALATHVGLLVSYWACLEALVAQLNAFLLKETGHSDPRPREFKRKLKLAEDEFKAAFAGHPELIAYFRKEIVARIKRVKAVRDLLNHSQIFGWSTEKGPCLRFVTTKLGKKTKRFFYEEDFQRISAEISQSAGRINQLAKNPDAVHVPSPSKLALQRVLDKDRWNQATQKALGIQPRSSRASR